MDFISAVWDCMGRNAGEIQIIIAIFALILGFFGFCKVLEQIKISRRQEDQAIDQRDFDLQLKTVDMLVTALENNKKHQNELYEIKDIAQKWMPIDEHAEKSKKEFIILLDEKIALIEGMRQRLVSLLQTYNTAKCKSEYQGSDVLGLAIDSALLDLTHSQTLHSIKKRMNN